MEEEGLGHKGRTEPWKGPWVEEKEEEERKDGEVWKRRQMEKEKRAEKEKAEVKKEG